MSAAPFLQSETFSLFVLPALIFLARICDVSIGTMRIIFVNRGLKLLAPLLGFFEVLIWLTAIGQVMANLTNVQNYIAYALGFAAGNYVGIYLESRIALGTQIVRVITRKDASELVAYLRSTSHTVTALDAQGDAGPVKVIFTVITRRELPGIIETIKRFNPNAFYSVEDVRFVSEGVLAPRAARAAGAGLRVVSLPAEPEAGAGAAAPAREPAALIPAEDGRAPGV